MTIQSGWQILKIGAGGCVTAISTANDGTVVCRTDTGGGYVYNRTAPNPGNAGGIGCWQQLINESSLDSSRWKYASINIGSVAGIYEIAIHPTTSTVIYVVWNNWPYCSTNFSPDAVANGTMRFIPAATFPTITMAPNAGSTDRLSPQKMAVDPNNPDKVFLHTISNGVYVTTNGRAGGGATWTLVAGGLPNNGFSGNILFVTSNIILIAIYNVGIYKSTDGGTTWGLISGSPTMLGPGSNLALDANGTTVFAADCGAQKVYRSVSPYTTWTDITSATFSGLDWAYVSCHPTTSGKLVAFAGIVGYASTSSSTSGTVTWDTFAGSNGLNNRPAYSPISTDIPYLQTLPQLSYQFGGLRCTGVCWDHLDLTKLWVLGLQSVFTTPFPLANNQVFTDVGAGIEQLCAQGIRAGPNGNVCVINQDIGALTNTNRDQYVSTVGFDTTQYLYSRGEDVDWCSSDPNTWVFRGCYGDVAKSTDGGQTFLRVSGSGQAPLDVVSGGSIAAETPNNIVLITVGDNRWMYNSTDGGATWHSTTLPAGVTWQGWGGSQFNPSNCQPPLACDRVINPSTGHYNFYALNGTSPGYFLKSTDGGTTWTATNPGFSTGNGNLRTVPGHLGNVFYAGFSYWPTGDGGTISALWRSLNADAANPTWARLRYQGQVIVNPIGVGIGGVSPKSPTGYATIYVMGFINTGTGPWGGYDLFVLRTFNGDIAAVGGYADPTWEIVGDSNAGPYGLYGGTAAWIDSPTAFDADPSDWRSCYAGFSGSGYRMFVSDLLGPGQVAGVVYNEADVNFTATIAVAAAPSGWFRHV